MRAAVERPCDVPWLMLRIGALRARFAFDHHSADVTCATFLPSHSPSTARHRQLGEG